MDPLLLEHLVVRDIRNLVRIEMAPSARITVIAGDNGQGKTSLLESLYFAATSRSFRTAKLAEMLRHGERVASVRALFMEGSDRASEREQTAALDKGQRMLHIDGKRPRSQAAFALRSPVVCFHAKEMELSLGPASARRKVLDRIALFVDTTSADHKARYQIALRSRQRALAVRGSGGADVAPFEHLCAVHGSALTRARQNAAEALISYLHEAFPRVAPSTLRLQASFAPGGSTDEEQVRSELAARRDRDRMQGTASYGPHHDDLALLLEGHPARVVASQGQHRMITLGLKLAELFAIANTRQLFPILLLDDVSSELDRERTAALLEALGQTRGQVFLTTTRPELIETPKLGPAERLDLLVEHGTVCVNPRSL